jgi:hypothetical protein
VSAAGVAFSDAIPLYDASGASTGGSEPSIEVGSHGDVYVSAPASVPFGGCPFWEIHPDSTNASGLPYEYRGTIDTDHGSVGGGDCDISLTDNPAPGATHDVASITSLSLANLTSNKTSDGGATFQEVANSTSQQVFAVDREWQASDRGLDRHYLTVHDMVAVNIQVSVSIDGGYQYVQNTPAINVDSVPHSAGTAVYFKGTSPGGNKFSTTVVNPVTHKLYIAFIAAAPDNVGGLLNSVYLAEGDPCAVAPCEKGLPAGPIVWNNHLIYSAAQNLDLSGGFPAIAIDKAGTVYVAWTGATGKAANAGSGQDANRVFMTHSQPGVVTPSSWTAPVKVDPGTAHSNVFPWMVAGNAGNVGVVWYTSVLTGKCAGATAAGVNNDCRNAWKVAYAASSNANTATPSWNVTAASDVIHEGSICDAGLSCADGTRTLLDFFDVAVDPQGRANIAYVSDMRAPGTADVQYTRQCSGTSLTGIALPDGCGQVGEPVGCAPSAGFVDPAGDATTPDASLDIVGSSLATNGAGNGITFKVVVDDLTTPLPGAAQNYIYRFNYKGKAYYVEAFRSTAQTTTTVYTVGDFTGSGGSRKSYKSITGSIDDATDTITMTLGYGDLAPVPALVAGDQLSALSITSGSAIGDASAVSFTPTIDSATGTCPFVVGSVTAEPVIPEVPLTIVLPLVALGMFGIVSRRRRNTRTAA